MVSTAKSPLLSWLIAACSVAMASPAQVGGHAHVADQANGMNLVGEAKLSPYLNVADGYWNFGEGFPKDTGGVLGPIGSKQQVEQSVTLNNIVTLLDWTPVQINGVQCQEYIGRFQDVPQGSADETRASFQIVMALDFPKILKPIVIALGTSATIPPQPGREAWSPHEYTGDPTAYDLSSRRSIGIDHTIYLNETDTSCPFQVVGAYAMLRVGHRPLAFAVQRLRQLRHAIVLKLLERWPLLNIEDMTVSVGGTSAGGFTTQCAVLLHPDEFHSGMAISYGGNHRSLLHENVSYEYWTSLAGLGFSGNAWDRRNNMEWASYCRLESTDHASLSLANRWLHGHVQRPIYFLIADEDLVTNGNDWLKILAGLPANASIPASGSVQGHPTDPDTRIYWTVGAKICHDQDGGDPWQVADPSWRVQTTRSVGELGYMMCYKAYEQRLKPPPFAIPQQVAKHPSLTTFEIHEDKAMDRLPSNQRNASGPSGQTLLREATPSEFRRFGCGTWLGAKESLKVARAHTSHTSDSAFVGSAEGIITRFQVETRTSGSTTLYPMIEKARSAVALGYAVFALDVVDLDADGDMEVVAGSYRRIAIYDAVSLALQASVQLPHWEYAHPQRLQVADVVTDAGHAGKEIIFATEFGHIVVMDASLAIIAEFEEAGCIDLVVGTQPTGRLQGSKSNAVYVLSSRGHVVALELAAQGSGYVQLLCAASQLQFGVPRDLELVTHEGVTRVAALFDQMPATDTSVRLFHPQSLTQQAGFGNLNNPIWLDLVNGDSGYYSVNPYALPNDTQVCLSQLKQGAAAGQYVTLIGDHLVVWHTGGASIGLKALRSFAPATNCTALAVGDVDGAGDDDVVVSTNSGHVVWFKHADLLSATVQDTNLPLPAYTRKVAKVGTEIIDDRTNFSLAATWAFTADPNPANHLLHAIDQDGTWWTIDAVSGEPVGGMAGLLGVKAMVPGGVESLTWGGAGLPALPVPFQSGTGVNSFSWEPLYSGSPALSVKTTPYVYKDQVPLNPNEWSVNSANPRLIPAFDGFLFQSHPIAAYHAPSGTTSFIAWWASHLFNYPDLVTKFRLDYPTSGPSVSLWNSTGPALTNGVRPSSFASPNIYLRTEVKMPVAGNFESIGIGNIAPGMSEPQVVVGTPGGRVILLNGTTGGKHGAESRDYGMGGGALGVGNLDLSGGTDEVVFAPLYEGVSSASAPARSRLYVLRHNGSAFTEVSSALFEIASTQMAGHGICGIAIADLDPGTPDPEIVVTSLNGELLVFSQVAGVLGAMRYWQILDSGLGVNNSIVVADLDPTDDSKKELYIPSTTGIRKWVRQ